MADFSILNFDVGLARVAWDTPVQQGELPGMQQLAPSPMASVQQIDRMTRPENIETSLSQTTLPSLGSSDILRPDRFEDGLRAAGRLLDREIEGVSGEDQLALQGLRDVLIEHDELKAAFNYYRDMLIAG
jgi:hypothetical protein